MITVSSNVVFFMSLYFRFPYINSCHMAPALKKIGRAQCTIFDLLTLEEATEHFSEKNKLGEGGFGIVYKVGNGVRSQENSSTSCLI